MLAALGLATIAVLLLAILKKWLSPLVALIVIPVIAGLAGGFGADISEYVVDGVRSVAPMAAMFVFAIIFFGVMSDAGLFTPFVNGILSIVGSSPPRIVVGTVVLAAIVHLDGSGAVTFLIAVPALRPLYEELGMDRRVLACAVAMGAGVNNMLPWGGPTIRAATALHMDVMEVYRPLIPVHVSGLLFVIACAAMLGVRERRRIASVVSAAGVRAATLPENRGFWRFVANLAVTLLVMAAMITGLLHPVVA
ncbi:MAG TPA: SLC13 family permease, partial [Hyphomicrobiales bacterium]|nr:SLC13 family permease [Hyphomicrobiales bacterium]